MKILIATPLYSPQIGGPATHTHLLEAGLSAHDLETKVLPFRVVAKYPPVIRHLIYSIRLFFSAKDTQLIFAQDPFSCGFPALVAARLRRIPMVVRIPGDYAWEQAREKYRIQDTVEEFQHKKYKLSLELLRAVERFVVRHADATVTPSRFIGRIVEQWYPRRLQVIHNGVDVPKGIVLPTSLPKRPFMVTASRLIYGKGFECLIDLMEDLPDWQLVIVGSGPLEQTLKIRAAERGVGERVRFVGAVSRAEMFGWYKAATAFILNTEFETFSFQVVESLAAGTPTIATKVGGIPEIVENGVQGVLVTPNDQEALKAALQSVLRDPAVWEKRKEAGLRRAQELSGAHSVEGFAKLFKEICRQ